MVKTKGSSTRKTIYKLRTNKKIRKNSAKQNRPMLNFGINNFLRKKKIKVI